VALLAALAATATPGAAPAMPWDIGGAVPPPQTPAATQPDPNCLQSYADDAPRGGPRLHLGVGPRLAGEAGTGQTVEVVPEDVAKTDAALTLLKGDRAFAVRLNRLFLSDGDAGIREFKRLARRFGRLGLDVELQVRYHPDEADDGDIPKWLRYVKRVVREFGPMPQVTSLQIANEVNIAVSPNTSDGAWENAVRALADGVITAKREARRLGHHQLEIGFNYAWRFDFADATNDARFWDAVGRAGGRRLRSSTDWVGIDIYPGTWVPGAFVQAPIVDYGDTFLEGIAQVRECFMPKAGLTGKTPIRIEETGYATGPGRSEADQLEAMQGFVTAAHRYRGTYNISDLRWFNLRDNNSSGPGFQQHYGLLRDDYTPKPAFALYRRLVARYGARQ
jgi:hypothetical protein